jgi:hypothetical protein
MAVGKFLNKQSKQQEQCSEQKHIVVVVAILHAVTTFWE